MQEKKKQILEAAVRLFARQGFHATSIQDIAGELGMAKGSIYFYFKSKDDLLVSVFQYYGELLANGMAEHPGDDSLPPRERLRIQLERQFRLINEHVEFLLMLFKEQFSGDHHDYLRSFALRFRGQFTDWLYRHMQNIYGIEGELYWADGVQLLGGMMNRYIESIAFDRTEMDGRALSAFLIRRSDDVMKGMIASGEAPVTSAAAIRRVIHSGRESGEPDRLQSALDELKAQAAGTDAEETVALLAAELNKPVPHRVVVRAGLALLEKQAPPDWSGLLETLSEWTEQQ